MMVWYSAPPASSPAPRLRARSMLSLGTEVFFAFWMASYSVGLPFGSPPPVRAATSMFLISRANSLPRRASLTAFCCLVVAHLEWPLISYYLFCRSQFRLTSLRGRSFPSAQPDQRQENAVDDLFDHLVGNRLQRHQQLVAKQVDGQPGNASGDLTGPQLA